MKAGYEEATLLAKAIFPLFCKAAGRLLIDACFGFSERTKGGVTHQA
jgi:hypothetical protein